jgi:osmotically-inducible protein OsmY
MNPDMQGLRRAALCTAAAIALPLLFSGCAPLLIGGAAVGGVMVATDRRTSGTQLEDETIELKSRLRTNEALTDRGHVNFTSFNRAVLITGEVASEADATAVVQAVTGVENVRSTVNELAVMGTTSLTSRSNDTLITSKVKALLVDAKDLHVNAIKVVTERATVYLMGRVTEREAGRAVEVARSVGGVARVVRVFEVVSEADLASGAAPKQ